MPSVFKSFRATPEMVAGERFLPPVDMERLKASGVVEDAEQYLGQPVPQLPATLYMQFYRNGNRSNYEGPYFARRMAIETLLFAELLEKQGRFTDTLVDYLWAVMEETSWVIPAHNLPCHGNPIPSLPDSFDLAEENDDMRHIDLFSAETAAIMAMVYSLGADILDPVTPVIRRRIKDMLKRRTFHPYYDVIGENNWWTGETGRVLMNWTPWIISNVLTAVMLCEDDPNNRAHALNRSIKILEKFTNDYHEDGGCDEGPGYWNHAAGSYFDCLEIINDLTAGAGDFRADPFMKKMAEYIADMELAEGVYANFADAAHNIHPDMELVARMARLTGSKKLTDYVRRNSKAEDFGLWSARRFGVERGLRNLNERYPEPMEGEASEATGTAFYPGIQVMVAKKENAAGRRFALAAKGGHNDEAHNHNDVGSFILYVDEKPVFIDAGVEQYTKTTFNDDRYTLWGMQSLYHNLPAFRRDGGEWIGEPYGRQYHGEVISCEDGVLMLELKNAYPEEAGIENYVRRIGVDQEGFFIEDRICLKKEAEISFRFLSRENWTAVKENVCCFKEANVTIEVPEGLSFSEEAVPLGPKLAREWEQAALNRAMLNTGSTSGGTYCFRVK